MGKKWDLVSKKLVFENKYRPVEERRLRRSDGFEKSFYITVSGDVVSLFGVTEDNKVLVLSEYYFAEQQRVNTLVGGFVEDEDYRKTAERELREESGCTAKEFVYLGKAMKSKYVTGYVHFYLAKGVKKVGNQELDLSEDIDVGFVELEEFKKMLEDCEINSVFETACSYRALQYLNIL